MHAVMPTVMHNAPPVSVIVPVCNGERFLPDALHSVLQQTRSSDEVIVVDDGSTDTTAAIVAELAPAAATPLHYVHQSTQGPAAARNHGLRLARGALIAFQDADDLWVAGRLAQQWALLERNADALAVLGLVHLLHTDPAVMPSTPALAAPLLLPSMPAGLFRRAAFDLVGEFDAALRFHEDIDWFRRARQKGLTVGAHPDVVLRYRRHTHNMTNNQPALQRELLNMLRRTARGQPSADDSLLGWLAAHPVS